MPDLRTYLRRKADDVFRRWRRNEISLADAAGELVALGWNAHAAWAALENT